MGDPQQQLLEKFYKIDNLVTVDIEMPSADWDKVRTAVPHFSWRGGADIADIQKADGHRYDPVQTTAVTLGGSDYPKKQRFEGVWIVKKSFGGSRNDETPSIKLEFGRMTKEMKPTASKEQKEIAKKSEEAAIAAIGTNHITLNNSIQDSSYIRQPLGYYIFQIGGVPYFRCNFAKVTVTDPTSSKQLYSHVYVNLEQPREQFMRRTFNNDKGNLYETEAWFDLTANNLAKGFDSGGFSKITDQQDLKVAITECDKGFATAQKVIDVEQISRVLAMCALVKHWDGYANNTFIYNDVVPRADPTADNGGVKLKIIPSGIDAILQPGRKFEVKNEGKDSTKLAWVILSDNTAKENLKKTCQSCAAVFAQNMPGYMQYIERMKKVLNAAGILNSISNEIDVVVKEVQGVPEGMKTVKVA